jgi:hypothetical protein
MYLLGFSKTAWDRRPYPDAGDSPGLSPFDVGFVVWGDKLRVLHKKIIFQA